MLMITIARPQNIHIATREFVAMFRPPFVHLRRSVVEVLLVMTTEDGKCGRSAKRRSQCTLSSLKRHGWRESEPPMYQTTKTWVRYSGGDKSGLNNRHAGAKFMPKSCNTNSERIKDWHFKLPTEGASPTSHRRAKNRSRRGNTFLQAEAELTTEHCPKILE